VTSALPLVPAQVVAKHLVGLGNALLALATAASPTACSSLMVVAINYIMSLTPTPEHIQAMGGLVQVRVFCKKRQAGA
jgi:hypothetical protein